MCTGVRAVGGGAQVRGTGGVVQSPGDACEIGAHAAAAAPIAAAARRTTTVLTATDPRGCYKRASIMISGNTTATISVTAITATVMPTPL